ncbi:MAG: 50S ribosomal protein L18 [Candidatus Marinimicrobia bacterium]|jgi:large subunit ribosomal protein L18|nr:50S ribosomal protein L18 [Candidatus Neomarinimicrobiota bacterium]MBT3683091.1 50S ribosomal protein L18 [Candidatus Neomarinimicrobiota bacterium]MBT3759817.1 50S ribosomal protein L18 [Candidatus Neomarinimicrobiota bacterium]MBT3895730.1 50S ribosomal protein L18 [Candidatus Neomarinimicrobiota bacterium]MBT4173231.1 50S ribosomal protein L18 [Candidatus Neomarinimicrobiota bacterium]
MAEKKNTKWKDWEKKRRRIKGRLKIGSEPRLVVYRSNNNLFAQVIDDVKGHTITSASTMDKTLSDLLSKAEGNIEKGKIIGKVLGERAVSENVSRVIFDRNGYKYHGVIKAIAESSKKAGLKF